MSFEKYHKVSRHQSPSHQLTIRCQFSAYYQFTTRCSNAFLVIKRHLGIGVGSRKLIFRKFTRKFTGHHYSLRALSVSLFWVFYCLYAITPRASQPKHQSTAWFERRDDTYGQLKRHFKHSPFVRPIHNLLPTFMEPKNGTTLRRGWFAFPWLTLEQARSVSMKIHTTR